jgi:hypothetical protein
MHECGKMKYDKKQHFVVTHTENRGKNGKVKIVKIGRFYCVLNDKTYPTLGGIRNFIKPRMLVREYYDLYYAEPSEGKCQICEAETRFISLIEGYNKHCEKCALELLIPIRNLAVANRFKGVDREEKLDVMRAKLHNTLDSIPQDIKDEIHAKRYETIKNRYGDDYVSNRTKSQWERRTEEDVVALVKKSNETKRLNVSLDKSNHFGNKKIIIKDKEYHCQGYEDIVLKTLIEDFNLECFVGKNIPRVDSNINSLGKHRSDIFVKELNLIIEVKSDWTLSVNVDSIITHQREYMKAGFIHIIFALSKVSKSRKMLEKDFEDFKTFLNMIISSQAQEYYEKVQRLSHDREYRAIVIGSGSARTPQQKVYDIVCSA